jgi:hypothetical protein
MLADEVHGDGILFFRHTPFLLEIVHSLCDCCRTLQIVEATHLKVLQMAFCDYNEALIAAGIQNMDRV